jgi:hypothetical protein
MPEQAKAIITALKAAASTAAQMKRGCVIAI